ncbi:tail sheath protein [Acinetobacter phage SH-Ab 15599]|nr:tail sheath protein [Acinetobacter phage SH-Ab 15599]
MATASNVLVLNEDELEFADFAGSPFIGRYPGSLANGIMISIADSATFSTWPFAYAFEFTPDAGQYAIAVLDTTGKIRGTGSAYQQFNVYFERIRTADPAVDSTITFGGATVSYNTADTMEVFLNKVETAFLAAASNNTKYSVVSKKVSGNTAVMTINNLVLGSQTPAFTTDEYIHISKAVTKAGGYGTMIEKYESVSMNRGAKKEDGTTNYSPDIINRRSVWIYQNPAISTLTPGDYVLAGGVDDYDTTLYNALLAYKNAEKYKFNYLFGATRPLEKKLIHEIVEGRRDCIGFVAPDMNDVVNNTGREMESVIDFRNVRFNIASTYVFTTDNWAQVYDQYNDRYVWIPTCGGTAGLKARTTNNENAWKSPAGYTRGVYSGYNRLAWSAEKAQRDELYKIGVNSIVDAGSDGIILFGDKMTTNKPTAFSRINVRSAFIVAEQSIANYAKYYLFENNNAETRSQFLNAVNPFFRKMVTQEAFERVETQVDENNNPLSVRQENRFVGNFRIWPQYSINYIDLYFQAEGTNASFEENEA